MVQKSENLKKSQKISKIPFFLFIFFWKKKFHKKKCFSLSFLILGGRDSTRALQSNMKISKYLKKSLILNFFFGIFYFAEEKKEKNPILLVFQY